MNPKISPTSSSSSDNKLITNETSSSSSSTTSSMIQSSSSSSDGIIGDCHSKSLESNSDQIDYNKQIKDILNQKKMVGIKLIRYYYYYY